MKMLKKIKNWLSVSSSEIEHILLSPPKSQHRDWLNLINDIRKYNVQLLIDEPQRRKLFCDLSNNRIPLNIINPFLHKSSSDNKYFIEKMLIAYGDSSAKLTNEELQQMFNEEEEKK